MSRCEDSVRFVIPVLTPTQQFPGCSHSAPNPATVTLAEIVLQGSRPGFHHDQIASGGRGYEFVRRRSSGAGCCGELE